MPNKTTLSSPLTLLAISCLMLAGCAEPTVRRAAAPADSRSSSPAPGVGYAVVDGRVARAPGIKMGSPATIRRIVSEGTNNSQVMDHLRYLCEDIGHRLTGSTNLDEAGRWAETQFSNWGLRRSRMEWWGDVATRFDRGPSTGKVMLLKPAEEDGAEPEWAELRDMELTTLAWTRGTNGPVRGKVVPMPSSDAELARVVSDISGAWILLPPDYSGRTGVRRSGFLMRQRTTERDEIRRGVTPDTDQAETAAAPEPVIPTLAANNKAFYTGEFSYHGSPVPMTLELTRTELGAIEGLQAIPGFHEGPIAEPVLEDGRLTYTWKHSMGTSNITLTTADNGGYTGESLNSSGVAFPMTLAAAPDPATVPETDDSAEDDSARRVLEQVLRLEPAGFISSSRDERVWTTSANGWRERSAADYPKDIEAGVRASDYDFMQARLAEGLDIHAELDLQNTVTEGPIPCYNTIAEIQGSTKPDEVVIVSAHLDSWNGPGSQGTVDNGTGSAVVIEAARILAASGARPDRTIRFILWTGEEQGLLGARAYVEALSDEELSKISAAFVDDGGTNHQGGLPAADVMVDYLAAATAPTNGRFFSKADYDKKIHDDNPDNDDRAGWMEVNIRPTGDRIQTHGGSDHAAFNAKGVPGFFWDEVGRANYRYAWHTQNDRLDQAVEEYLVQSAVNMAITAYNLASAPDLLPRATTPPPEDNTQR